MATNMTRFEVQIPFINDPAKWPSITKFLDNLGTLCSFTYAPQYTYTNMQAPGTQIGIVYGMITTAQQATALGFLNTLNSDLGVTVVCIVWQVTTEP